MPWLASHHLPETSSALILISDLDIASLRMLQLVPELSEASFETPLRGYSG